MNHDFDFNINNYSIIELQKFINLGEKYTLNDISTKCNDMNDIISKSKDYDKVYKNLLGKFLENAKIRLINHIKKTTMNEDGFSENYDELLIYKDNSNVVNKTSTTYAGSTYVMKPETITFDEIIDKSKSLEPLETFPTNISRGILNNLKRKTITQTIVLNTLFREDYFNTTSTDFTIVLPYYFKNVLSLRLSSLQLPNVLYCISKFNENNYLYIEEDVTGVRGLITIPDGNYDIQQFTSTLQMEINTQLGISPDRFLVFYDDNTHKITILNNSSEFSLIFNEPVDRVSGKNRVCEPSDGQRQQQCVDLEQLYKKLGWIIGYRKNAYYNSNSYTTEGVFNGTYSNYIYFVLNDYNNSQAQNVFGMFSKSIIGDNILGMIPISSQAFYENFTNGNDFIERKREYFGPVRIQRLKIQLLNQYGDVINLNNMDYSFTLELEISYDI